jgi:hypothetical protein
VTLLRRWKFGKGRHIDFTLYASRTSGLEQQRRPTLTQRRWSRLMEEVNSVLGTARARLGPDRP